MGERGDGTGEAAGKQQTEEEGPDGPGQGRQQDRGAQRGQALQIDVDPVVHVQDADDAPGPVPDGREGGDPRAALVLVDGRVGGDIVSEARPQGLDECGDQRVELPRRARSSARDHESSMPRQLIEVGERVDRRLETVLILDRGQRRTHAHVGVRVPVERALHLGVERRIHQQRAGARDVEQQRAKGRLELPLLVLVDERPDHPDGQKGHPDQQTRGTDAQPLPGAELERRGRRWAPWSH